MKIIETNKWKKIGQFSEENTVNTQSPLIVIEPFEPIVSEVCDDIRKSNPNFFKNVNKLKIDMGFGQFGSVSSENPADININFQKIKNEVSNRLGGNFDVNNQEHKNVLKMAIRETILHEKGHVEDAWTANTSSPDKQLGGESLFPGGESAAENFVRKFEKNNKKFKK